MEPLLELIKVGLGRAEYLPPCNDWHNLMVLAFDQGIGGICFDAVQKVSKNNPGLILMKDDYFQKLLFMEWLLIFLQNITNLIKRNSKSRSFL